MQSIRIPHVRIAGFDLRLSTDQVVLCFVIGSFFEIHQRDDIARTEDLNRAAEDPEVKLRRGRLNIDAVELGGFIDEFGRGLTDLPGPCHSRQH